MNLDKFAEHIFQYYEINNQTYANGRKYIFIGCTKGEAYGNYVIISDDGKWNFSLHDTESLEINAYEHLFKSKTLVHAGYIAMIMTESATLEFFMKYFS